MLNTSGPLYLSARTTSAAENFLAVAIFSRLYKARWSTHRLVLYSYERPLTFAGWLFLRMRRARHVAGITGVRQWLGAGR
jgi:hypothetical protein